MEIAKMAALTGRRWPVVGRRLSPEFPYIEEEVKYAIKEYACTAVDVMARRTRLAFLHVQAADEALPKIVEIMGNELKWTKAQRQVCMCMYVCMHVCVCVCVCHVHVCVCVRVYVYVCACV